LTIMSKLIIKRRNAHDITCTVMHQSHGKHTDSSALMVKGSEFVLLIIFAISDTLCVCGGGLDIGDVVKIVFQIFTVAICLVLSSNCFH
jgi:hypothetical protein